MSRLCCSQRLLGPDHSREALELDSPRSEVTRVARRTWAPLVAQGEAGLVVCGGFSISFANAVAKSAPEMSALPSASPMRMSVPRRWLPVLVSRVVSAESEGWADVEPVDGGVGALDCLEYSSVCLGLGSVLVREAGVD